MVTSYHIFLSLPVFPAFLLHIAGSLDLQKFMWYSFSALMATHSAVDQSTTSPFSSLKGKLSYCGIN